MLIGGALVAARSGATAATINPATEEPIAEVPMAGAADVDDAVAAARDALEPWQRLTVAERGAYLHAVADAIERRAHEFARLDALDAGNPLGAMLGDVRNAVTALPRLLAMLCILAVFVSSFFMQGAARALFVPLSLAVGFAMIASYILSSTFVPVMCVWLLKQSSGKEHAQTTTPFDRLRGR